MTGDNGARNGESENERGEDRERDSGRRQERRQKRETRASSTHTRTDHGLEARVAALERTVRELQEELDRRGRALRLLAGNADVAPITARCPECETGELRRESGLSWAKLHCTDCDASWEL